MGNVKEKCIDTINPKNYVNWICSYRNGLPWRLFRCCSKRQSIRENGITTFLFHVSQCIIFNLTNQVKTILIANVSLKKFYSRLGFLVIKDFATYTTFEAARSRSHYDTGKSKEYEIKTIGLQCLYTIPRRVKFLHEYRINFNTQKNVFRDLDGISTSVTFFPKIFIMMRSRKE